MRPDAIFKRRPLPHYAGAVPLTLWGKSVRRAAKFTQWRSAPGKKRGADPAGLGLQGPPARPSVKRVARRSRARSRANQSGFRAKRCLWLCLVGLILAGVLAAQSAPSSPSAPPAPQLQRAVSAVRSAVGNLDPSSLQLPRTDRDAVEASQASIMRNLSEAVPGLFAALRAQPSNLAAAFRLYRDLETVLGVSQQTAAVLPSGSDQVTALLTGNSDLQNGLQAFGDWIETSAQADFTRRQAAAKAAAAPPPPPPKTLIINNANSPSPKHRPAH